MHEDTAYPREGTVTQLRMEVKEVQLADTAYPREGTVTLSLLLFNRR